MWERFKGTATTPWRQSRPTLSWVQGLPRVTGADVKRAGLQFKKTTGLGCDGFRPQWFSWLSNELLDQYANLLTVIENMGAWPALVTSLLIVQIPKAGGGRRPIGLLATLIRVWEKIRKPVMEVWRTGVERSYNFAGKGKSSDIAAWLQAHKAEYVASKGESSAASLVDLTRAFEMVPLELVWAAGLRLHCPPAILRLELEAFSLTRRLVFRGAVADPIQTYSSILAGGSFATDALFMVMSGVCDRILVENPGVNLCLFVDDLTVHVEGPNDSVASARIIDVTQNCINILENNMGFVVSRGKAGSKTVVVHSGLKGRHGKLVKKRLGTLGVKVVRQAKLLGVDYTAGKRVRRSVQMARIRNISKRVARYKQLGKRAARHVVRTGAGPGLRYGASSHGITNTALKAVRFFSCGALGSMRGRSCFARLALTGYDVGALMAVDPIVQWSNAFFDKLVPLGELQATWKRAIVDVTAALRPFSNVAGSAGAYAASVGRLGWRMPSYRHLLLTNGTLIAIDSIAPKDLQLLALKALHDNDAMKSSLASIIGGPPDLTPLKTFVDKKGLGYQVKESLRSLGEGGWWTQKRMHEAGLQGVDDDLCQVCHLSTGTLLHRCASCPGLHSLIAEHATVSDIVNTANSAVNCNDSLFQHGIPTLSALPDPPLLVVRWCGGVKVDNPNFTGDVYTDGSVIGGCRRGLERGGWAAIQMNQEGKIIFGTYGPCPDRFPSSLRAELWALLIVLRHAMPPLTVWLDNDSVVKGFRRGRHWCLSSGRPAVDLWTMVWLRLTTSVVKLLQSRRSRANAGLVASLHLLGNE